MKYLYILLFIGIFANAQTEGVWEEYSVFGDELHFIENVEVHNIKGTYILSAKSKTFTFRRRLDGSVVTDLNKHGEYYSFDKDNNLHANDSSGQLDPDYIILNKIK